MRLAVAFLCCVAAMPAAQFTNGSFESPGGDPIRQGLTDGGTFVTGWLNQGNGQIYESSNQDGILAGDGSYYVSFGHSGAVGGTFTQSFDTVVGAIYSVNYLLSLQQGSGTVDFQVEALDGSTQLASVTNTVDTIAWLSGTTLQFTATSGTSTLRFTDLGGPGNSGTNTALDAISVDDLSASGVPEPNSLWLAAPALLAFTRFRKK